ncbi:hypothetical protein [Nakamurella sp.]|uniref:hypothetical protein n=1 Tax=Nakamurella sp. TaxID=1869182 RepID=UPI003B3A316B
MLNSLTVSVLATYRWVVGDDATTTAVVDGRGYLDAIVAAQQGRQAAGLTLPWSRYFNRLWRFQLGADYRNLPPRTMVGMLVPLRMPIPGIGFAAPAAGAAPVQVDAELIWHPFAVTTMATLRIAGDSWRQPEPLGSTLQAVLRSAWTGAAGQVGNGLPLPALPAAWQRDAAGRPCRPVPVSTTVLISGRHHAELAPGVLASALATGFKDPVDRSSPLQDPGGFLALRDHTVALVVPNATPNGAAGHLCLHANTAMLLAMIENLRVLGDAAGLHARWYRDLARPVLTHLYDRTDHPAVGTGYRSRVAQVWLDARGDRPAA